MTAQELTQKINAGYEKAVSEATFAAPSVSTPITDSAKFNERGTPLYATVPADLCADMEREKAFYRDLLEQITQDPRKTRARRLAESGLIFWDAIMQGKRQRANSQLSEAADKR